ncbi:hypothetical protein [Streptomyces scopuliridis]|uniref:Uncharacterized protein n=1 Tax=Streptomyces scopuliridis RB72 TaxID=1440053 RepID=A0A2T7T984_9ACTN|nr:hypothetical protein [Streptomyces scopuliridis]PVE11665.1 hypothetical protein Y717_31350 [Streptomyces scopuliridis RB72]
MDYDDLLKVDLGKLSTAASDWKTVFQDLERLADNARDGMKAKSDKARWQGANATVTRAFVGKTAKEFDDLRREAKSIWSVMNDAHGELEALQRRAKDLTAEAGRAGLLVTSGQDGRVKVMEVQCTPESSGQKKLDEMQWYADTLTDIVSHAGEIDEATARALRGSHGGNPDNAGHGTYTSLDEDMFPRAVDLARLGNDASSTQRQELRRLWESLSPEARARLWSQQRDGLLDADIFAPQVRRGAVDDGAGPYDVEDPGWGDRWIHAQAGMITDAGDFIGNTDASRHMNHYLEGSGDTLNLDVDRMLTDDETLRLTAETSVAQQQDRWRQQALEAFEQSGGKPVSIPVETPAVGYTHSDRNWYLAVGSAMSNTTGAVTVVPGADGRPQVTLDYQVNVWDRYNWDPGKSTPIGPTTVTDADMARLHTTGLAREFDMRGSGSTQHVELGSGSAQLPDPPDPGRDGERTDPGREGVR